MLRDRITIVVAIFSVLHGDFIPRIISTRNMIQNRLDYTQVVLGFNAMMQSKTNYFYSQRLDCICQSIKFVGQHS